MRRKHLLVGAVAVFGCGLLVFGAGELLIRRATGPSLSGVRPAEGVEEVLFTARDAVALRGWWWPGRDPKRAVVLLHGWGANRLQMLPRARWLHDYGYSVFLFDFRGCGLSGGTPSLGYTERLDVAAALRFLREQRGVEHSVLIGESMGAAAAVMAVEDWQGVKGAVLESLFDRLDTAIRARVRRRIGPLEPIASPLLLWQVRARLGFLPEELSPVDSLRHARCAVLLGYGGRDPYLSPDAVRGLFKAAPSPATLWVLQRAGHEDLHQFDPRAYEDKVATFLGETLGPPDRECRG